MTDKLDLELGQANDDNDEEMDGDRIVIYQAVRHLFFSCSAWNFEKPFGVGKLVRRVHVLVDHREPFD